MKRLACLLVAFFLFGCSQPTSQPQAGQKEKPLVLLSAGLKNYEDGDYAEAAQNFYAALDAGLPIRDQVDAHKYLAIIYCIADLEPACRSEFRRALLADPKMELDPAEAGHPKWGPVFQQVRAGR
jgi:Tfp pilus assembly protein PilF